MYDQNDRLRIWTEQGNMIISQLFFQFYKELNIKDLEALVLLHLTAFHSAGNDFPTPDDIASRMQLSQEEVTVNLQSLVHKGLIKISPQTDQDGVLFETISLYPLWDRLVDCVCQQKEKETKISIQEQEGEIFKLFEQEFGRFLSPMESETISLWLDDDGHTPDIIRMALKEAVLAQKLSLRYVDRILFEWKKKNVKTRQDVEKQVQAFRKNNISTNNRSPEQSTKKVPFYNWLEERE